MDEILEERLILSRTELHLCMCVCGSGDWNDFPLPAEETPLEKRMLSAFVRLTARGVLCAHGEQYTLSSRHRELLEGVAHPDWKCILLQQKSVYALYGGKSGVFLAETDAADISLCALSAVTEEKAFSALAEKLHIVAQTDGDVSAPQEPFSAESAAERLVEASEAVLLFSHTGEETPRRARVFIENMTPWFSALQEGGAPTPYRVQDVIRWMRRMKEQTI